MSDVAIGFMPLRYVMPWPEEVIPLPTGGPLGTLLDRVMITACSTYTDDQTQEVVLELGLSVLGEVVLPMPAVEGIELTLNSAGGLFDLQCEVRYGDVVSIRFANLTLGLRITSSFVRPATLQNGVFVVDTDVGGNPLPYQLALGGIDLEFTTAPAVTMSFAAGAPGVVIPPAMLSDTGVVVEATGILFHFTGDGTPPAGAPAGFRGVELVGAAVHLPSDMSVSVVPTDFTVPHMLIGSGGVTGRIEASWQDDPSFDAATGTFSGPGTGTLLGTAFALQSFALELRQNSFVASAIKGRLALPFFDEPADVELGLKAGGGFTAKLASSGGLLTLTKPDLLTLTVASIGFETGGGELVVTVSGALTPLIGDVDWPTFQINALTIDSRGHVKIDGGWLDFPSPVSFELYGFRAEVSKIGFGTEDDGTRWIGLSASMQFVQSFALGGSVEGLKIKWKGSDVSLELRGVGVELLIPKTLQLSGKMELIDDGTRKGFKGGVQLTVLPINLAIDAQLLVGRNSQSPAYTFAYVFLAAELPVGIPLLNTGLAFYGFAGLVGYNVAPAKGPDEPWFEGWYLKPPVGVSGVDKWRDERDAFALGVGTTIGTLSDNGYAFNGRFLLVLVLPGPLILLDGRASFLQARGSGEPNFLSLAIFDGRAGTVLFNVQAHYAYTPSGDLIDITGFAEAFFDFAHPKKWHLYLGQDTPESKRIRANIVSLFEANSYFMLTHTGVRMGAWFGLDRKWKYGPLKVTLEAWIEGAAAVSWAPKQFEGSLTLHGDVGLKAFGVGASLNLHALLEARAPHPYRVHAEFKVKLNLPWPLPDPKAKVKMTWEEELPPPTPRPLEILGLEHLKVSEKWVMATSAASAPVVPLDARPVISFQRRMTDHTGLATNALPSSPERAGGYRFRYRLEELHLEMRSSSAEPWVDATTPPAPSLPAGTLWTTWLAAPSTSAEASPQGVPPMTKVMMWSRTPLDYGRETPGTGGEDGFADENPAWPCGYDWTPIQECADFEDRPPGPMPPFSQLDRLVIATRGGQIVKWGGDWISVSQAAVITGAAPAAAATTHVPPRSGAFRIVFPSHAAAAFLYVGKGTDGFYRIAGEGQKELVYAQEAIEVSAGDGTLGHVDLWGNVALLRVCWVAKDEWDRVHDGLLAGAQLGTQATDAMTAEAELLQPHRQYRMTVTTLVERSSNGGSSWPDAATFTDTGYFRTESPPGLSTEAAGSQLAPTNDSEHYPSRGPLKDLTSYVHRTIPAPGARPVYRAYDVGVEFNESYVESMYLLTGAPLVLQLHDSNGEPVADPSGAALDLMAQWRPLEDAQLVEVERPEESRWMELLTGGGCVAGAAATPPPAEGVWTTHPRLLLEPNTIYRALLGPIVPVAVIPLEADGTIVRANNGNPRVVQLAGSASDRLEQLYSAGASNKLLVVPGTIVETSLGAQAGAIGFDVAQLGNAQALAAAVAEVTPVTTQGALARVYDWTFTTSRFATFVHHLQSYRDDAASLHVELGQPAAALLSAAELAWLDAIVAARPAGAPRYLPDERESARDEEGRQHDRVLELFGMNDRALPKRVVITVLDDATRSYGVLIESPEPLAWERIELTAGRRADSAESLLDAASPLKLVAVGYAASDAASDLVNEFVDLLVLESIDPAATTIQVLDSGNAWQDHHTFAGGDVIPAGTVLRVHTGPGAEDPAAEVEHHYVSPGPSARRFGAGTVRLRVVDSAARLMHERLFAGPFSAAPFRVLRSRDGVRALLFFAGTGTAVGSLPGHAVRLNWRFRRNILPEEPVLRRMSSDRDELATSIIAVP